MKKFIIPVLILLIILLAAPKVRASSKIDSYRSKGLFYPLNGSKMIIRNDDAGKGHYGASRGSRSHDGIDIEFNLNAPVYSPIDGYIVREFKVYGNDSNYWGVEIEGAGLYSEYTVKIMYVSKYKTDIRVYAGQKIAIAQSIKSKYGYPMEDHLHVELFKNGIEIDPTSNFFNFT